MIGGIQGAYERIELIAEDIQVRFVAEELAIVIFQYRTECVRRETGESYGIRGLETQVVQKWMDNGNSSMCIIRNKKEKRL